MPEPAPLRLVTCDGQVLVTWGRCLVYHYDADDTGMRNMAIVALTDAGRRVDEVARLFGLTAAYVSILRGRARQDGSAGLVRRRGRPRKLSERQVGQARVWAGAGQTRQAIADRLGVARSVISELLTAMGPVPVQEVLPATAEPEPTTAEPATAEPTEPATTEPATIEPATAEPIEPATIEPATAEPIEPATTEPEPTAAEPGDMEKTKAGAGSATEPAAGFTGSGCIAARTPAARSAEAP